MLTLWRPAGIWAGVAMVEDEENERADGGSR